MLLPTTSSAALDWTKLCGTPEAGLYGHNITAGFFWEADAVEQFRNYLIKMENCGFRKQIRIATPMGWADTIAAPLLQVLRERGWKAIVIVDPEPQYRKPSSGFSEEATWARGFIGRWQDIIMGVEPANEPWHQVYPWGPPELYGEWHRIVDEIAGDYDIPVIAGYFSGHKTLTKKIIFKYYEKALGPEWWLYVDIISWNTTEKLKVKKAWQWLEKKIPNLRDRAVIGTEVDYRHVKKFPIMLDGYFVYTCADENTGKSHLNRCP